MERIRRKDIVGNQLFVPIFTKFIYNGFIDKNNLAYDEIKYCNRVTWIRKQIQFFCEECQMNHKVDPENIICPARQTSVENPELTQGFQLLPGAKLPELENKEYKIKFIDSRKEIEPKKIEHKTIYFTPTQNKVELYDLTGKIAVAPIERLPNAYTSEGYEKLKTEVKYLIGGKINWEKLDSKGDEFQELTYDLLRLENEFSNVTPGGTGPDQGKDGYCYREIGRRNIKVLVQVKFNNNGSGLNKKDINSMMLDAQSLDCSGLLVITIKTTGDLETKLGSSDFMSQMLYLDLWEKGSMRSKISNHPSLIEKYF